MVVPIGIRFENPGVESDSFRFIQDFKDGNENNDIVKLCMDQGWIYEAGSNIFYHPEAIYANQTKFPLAYIISTDDKGDFNIFMRDHKCRKSVV